MKSDLVEHHTKYKEIHGIDETIWMTPSEHVKLHKRLREENKCNIPPDELHKITKAACMRTDKIRKLVKSHKQTKQYKDSQKRYNKDIIEKIVTYDTVAPNILLSEEIVHNKNTRTIFVLSNFRGNHGMKLITKEI